MTVSPTKPVAPLSEEAMAEIESRFATTPALWTDVAALCQTVRALRDELTVADDALENQVKQIADLRAENAALREQLAEAVKVQDYWRERASEASKAAEKWYHERY